MGFRKPQQHNQGIKFLIYGEDSSGKSVFTFGFPKIAFIDTESKVGVYENNPKYNKNFVNIADTTEYYDIIDLMEEVLNHKKDYSTFVIDSATNMNDSMKVAVMEVEEEKAKKWNKNIDDATIAMRGWGKIGLNTSRFKNYLVQLSAEGFTVISVAHMKPIYDKDDDNRKIGEKPDLKEGSKHDYDVVLRFYKEKYGKDVKFFCEVEKDTTEVQKVGTIIPNPSYEVWKEYIENNAKMETVKSDYKGAIQKNKEDLKKSEEDTGLSAQVLALSIEKAKINREKVMETVKKYDASGNPKKIKDDAKLQELKKELELITE